jgi:hypothetical protein
MLPEIESGAGGGLLGTRQVWIAPPLVPTIAPATWGLQDIQKVEIGVPAMSNKATLFQLFPSCQPNRFKS